MSSTLLLTGASGFLGRAMYPLLARSHRVVTLGRSAGCDVRADLAAAPPALPVRPDIVIHAAGLAHISRAPRRGADPFLDVNLGGTRNLCRALEAAGVPRSLVYISSVAVYGLSSGTLVPESAPLLPVTPYGRSKLLAEQYLADWCARTGCTLSVLRPSLIAALGAPGNLGRLVRALRRGRYLSLGDGPGAPKSLVCATDVARLALLAAPRGGIFNACSSGNPGFREIEARLCAVYGLRRPPSLPLRLARLLAHISPSARKILSPLTFDNSLARAMLHFNPSPWYADFPAPASPAPHPAR